MLPTPVSYYLHQMPSSFHTVQVLLSLVFELVVPFFLFLGRRMRIFHGVLQIGFQVAQSLSGNLGFMNWLTIVPSIACFDDASIGLLFPSGNGATKDQVHQLESRKAVEPTPRKTIALVAQVAGPSQQRGRGRSRLQQEADAVTRDMNWFLSKETSARQDKPVPRGREEPEAAGSRVLVSPAVAPVPVFSRSPTYWTRSSRWDLQGLAQQLSLQAASMVPAWAVQTSERRQVRESPQTGDVYEETIKHQAIGAAAFPQRANTTPGFNLRACVNIGLGVLIAYLSIPLLQNRLMSPQASQTIFSPLRIVNTYSTFSRITKVRTEIVLQGTSCRNHDDPSAVWEEYEFRCKPGDLKRSPCVLSPFHYRLDWLMWYAALQTYEQNEWVIHLAGKLLAAGNRTSPLLQTNPFLGKKPPRWIRGEHFIYKFSQIGGKHAKDGRWWNRKRIGPYFPPVSISGLKTFFKDRSWPHPPEP